VRALRADHYAIADRLPENGFIDLNMRIGAGRSASEKTRLGEAIFAAAVAVLAPLFLTPHFALSLEIREIDAALSWKRNAIHPRLRAR
jgi:5-carboxymethyl-2-hydroxymuconate isomerase